MTPHTPTPHHSPAPRSNGLLQLAVVIAFVIGSFIVSRLLATSYEPPGQNAQEQRRIVVDTTTATRSNYQISFTVNATVQARSTINIVPEVSGRITHVNDNAFAGGAFNRGDTLFRINPQDFTLTARRLDAEVARARTALALEQAEAEAALTEWAMLNEDKPAPDLVARTPQLQEAKANLTAAQAQLDDAQLDVTRTQFSLPFNGRIIASDIAVGQYVMMGQMYGTAFDIATLEAHASLQDEQLRWLMQSPNPDITITTQYLGTSTRYKATLTRTGATLDDTTRFARVRFGFATMPTDLVPGIFATVNVDGITLDNVTVLSSAALQDNNVIWLVSPDNRLYPLTPDIAYSGDGVIVVRNVDDGATIVTSRVSGAVEGTEVTIAQGVNSAPSDEPSND